MSLSELESSARHLVRPASAVSTGWPAIRAACERVGLGFDPWQDGAGRIIFAKREDGLWAAEAVVLSIPRQVGKTYLIGAAVFALCLAEPGTLVLWTAHRVPTAAETFGSIKALVEQPRLRPHIVSATAPAGNGVVKFRNGSRILFGAREKGFGRGFQRVGVVVYDEAQILTQAALDDMIPATNAHPNPLVFFMGTPPKPSDPSEAFQNMRHEALSGEASENVYIEFGADEDADPNDREQWAKANPSYPHRTKARAILRMKRLLGPESFLREGLGIWDRVGGLGVFTAGAWSRCFIGYDDDGKPREPDGEPLALAVSADLGQTTLTLAAAGGDAGKHHLGTVATMRADTELDAFCAEVLRIQDERDVPVGIDAKGPASFAIPALEEAGVRLTLLKLDDFIQACADLRTAVEQGAVTHGNYDALNAAVDAAAWRKVGDRRAFARKSGNIAPLEGVAIARWVACNEPSYDLLDSIA